VKKIRSYPDGDESDTMKDLAKIENADDENISKRIFGLKTIGQCCGKCCTSYICIFIAVAVSVTIISYGFILQGEVKDYFALADNNPTGVPNIQQDRDRSWDGGNQKDVSRIRLHDI